MAIEVPTVGSKCWVAISGIVDEDGGTVDPTDMQLIVRKPFQDAVTYTYNVDGDVDIQRIAAGSFKAYIVPDVAGRWEYDWHSATYDYTKGGVFVVNPRKTDQ